MQNDPDTLTDEQKSWKTEAMKILSEQIFNLEAFRMIPPPPFPPP